MNAHITTTINTYSETTLKTVNSEKSNKTKNILAFFLSNVVS